MCLFCQGGGCEVCQSVGRGYLLGALRYLLPYGEAGLCAQRWYDVSADVMFLSHTRTTDGTVLTTQGVQGTPVLFANSADDSNLRAGGRISAAFICGAGGNLEGTYMGGNEWSDRATVTSATPTLYSFISRLVHRRKMVLTIPTAHCRNLSPPSARCIVLRSTIVAAPLANTAASKALG